MRKFLKSRKLAALFALVSLLFSQIALGWYQCPGESAATLVQAEIASGSGGAASMAGCDGMDLEHRNLCLAHAQAGNQSLDRPQAPDVPAFAMTGPSIAVEPIAAVFFNPVQSSPGTALLARSTAPPIAIRNCCFRI